jgi:hypothetical protein
MGYEAYFYEPAAGGHGYGKDNRERSSFTARSATISCAAPSAGSIDVITFAYTDLVI